MASRKKINPNILTLGLERVKTPKARATSVPQVKGVGRVAANPDQVPLMMPSSKWVRPSELPDLHNVDEIGLDTETVDNGLQRERGPGWAWRDGHIAGVGVAWRTGTSIQRIYVPVAHPDTDNFPKEQVANWVTEITRKKRVVMFNAGYDIGWLKADMGVPIPPVIDDASCAAFLVDENREDLSLGGVCDWRGVPGKNMDALREAAVAFGYRAKDAVKIIGKLPARFAAEYGGQDPVSTLDVMTSLRPELARQGLLEAYRTEMRLIPLMHEMRRRGVRVDLDRAEKFQGELVARADKALHELSTRLKVRVGLDEVRSHLWLVRTFSNENVPTGQRGDKATFERDWMRRAEHWLPRLCAEARQCMDMHDKFVGTYLLEFAHNGRIHASINQWLYEEGGTRSHRLSYADPPLQQAPSRGEPFDGWPLTEQNAIAFRNCFLPEDGELWFSPDYSQQEYRHIVADAEKHGLEKADVAAQMYRDDPKTDFHNLVVEMTGLARRGAKDCNFAKVFGAGTKKFATMINKPFEEAEIIMGTYDRELPFVKQLSAKCQKFADSKGYINMFDGARSHFDAWEVSWLPREEFVRGLDEGYKMNACSLDEAKRRQELAGHPWRGERLKRAHTHKAMNRRIQGGAARQMKLAMAQCGDEGYVPLLQLHDELCFSLSSEAAGQRITEIMQNAYTTTVPFLVDAEWGATWGDAKHPFKIAEAGWRENRHGGAGGRGQGKKGRKPVDKSE